MTLDAQTVGRLNADLDAQRARLAAAGGYQDQATVIVTPSRDGKLDYRWVERSAALLKPMNQKVWHKVWPGLEVGAAYEAALRSVLAHPDLKAWPFLLTWETDNFPEPDALLKLLAAMHAHPEFAAVGGLYWTKGLGGQPMVYGDPAELPRSFRPQVPRLDCVQECNGVAMGFTLWRLAALADPRLPQPLFKTEQAWDPGSGVRAYTQDLYACEKLRELGYRVAVDTRVKVGHIDYGTGEVW
jgi:hypothetical protein